MERLTAARIEVRHYSVPGYNAQQELRMFQTRIKPYRPDCIILHRDHNDAEPTAKLMGAASMPVEYGDNPLRSALLKWSVRRLRQL